MGATEKQKKYALFQVPWGTSYKLLVCQKGSQAEFIIILNHWEYKEMGVGEHIQKTQHEIINVGNSFTAYKPSKHSAPNKGIYFASQHQVAITLEMLSIMLQPTIEIPPAFLKLQPNSCFSNHKRIPQTFWACDVHHTKLGVRRQASVFLVFVHLGRGFFFWQSSLKK